LKDELILKCADIYATDPNRWEYVIQQAKKKALNDKFASSSNNPSR
jgi:hypothetical protein